MTATSETQTIIKAEPDRLTSNRHSSEPAALITGSWADIGKFEGPILRGLAARAPYFHNGSADNLSDVIEFYNKRFLMNLSDQEKAEAVEEGLQYVDKALEKNPNYQDALAYKNLLLRDKAAGTKDPEEAKRYLAEADVFFKKALEARNQPAADAKAAEGAKK